MWRLLPLPRSPSISGAGADCSQRCESVLADGVGVLVGEIEEKIDFLRAEPLDGEEMAVGEVECLDFGDCAGH